MVTLVGRTTCCRMGLRIMKLKRRINVMRMPSDDMVVGGRVVEW